MVTIVCCCCCKYCSIFTFVCNKMGKKNFYFFRKFLATLWIFGKWKSIKSFRIRGMDLKVNHLWLVHIFTAEIFCLSYDLAYEWWTRGILIHNYQRNSYDPLNVAAINAVSVLRGSIGIPLNRTLYWYLLYMRANQTAMH